MGHIHQMLPEHVPEAPKGAPRRTVTLTLIGTLVHCWSNNEKSLVLALALELGGPPSWSAMQSSPTCSST
jgi:hypothetical protein